MATKASHTYSHGTIEEIAASINRDWFVICATCDLIEAIRDTADDAFYITQLLNLRHFSYSCTYEAHHVNDILESPDKLLSDEPDATAWM